MTRHKEELKEKRMTAMLTFSLGKIEEFLQNPHLTEIMVNPDGKLWIDHLETGRQDTGLLIPPTETDRLIKLVASQAGAVCNADNPTLSADLPMYKARFQGMIPPVVAQPCFAIRKHARRIFSLSALVKQGVLTISQAKIIQQAIAEQQNILIVGGTASGKTTFANALLFEIGRMNQRLIIIEDTPELQVNAEDHLKLTTTDELDMNALLKSSLRLRPDRIIVGELRDGASALTFLKATNTGHKGSLTTLHANGVNGALIRLEQLIQEVLPQAPRHLIAETIDLIIFIVKEGKHRRIKEMGRIRELDEKGGKYLIDYLE